MDDLIQYFRSNNVKTFSAVNNGSPIIVKSIQDFTEANSIESVNGKLYSKVKVCHTLTNRNGSHITEEDMKKAMPSLKDSPLLGYIHQLDDATWDFYAHNAHIEQDDDGNDVIVYDESQIGNFTAQEPYLEYDAKMDKTYVIAQVAIPEEYTKAASIIKKKKGTKVSCELAIYDCSYNAKENYLQIKDFIFMGCTCLGSEKDGTPIGEGMLGSKLTLEDFSARNLPDKYETQLIELQSKLDTLISRFNTNDTEKGGNKKLTKFEELLEKHNKTVEDIIFDYETLNDKELEEKFAELFADGNPDQSTDTVDKDLFNESRYSFDDNGNMSISFELSHDDIRIALYKLISPYEEQDNDYYHIACVYDDKFIVEGWCTGSLFGFNYSKDGDNVSLSGERYKLFREFITESERTKLEEMRSNYAELVKYKEDTENAKLNAQKDTILKDEKYTVLVENEKYKTLCSEKENYSVDEFEREL